VGGSSEHVWQSNAAQADSGCLSGQAMHLSSRMRFLRPDHSCQINLLKSFAKINGIKKYLSFRIRYDLLEADKKHYASYMQNWLYHISGQLKVAPNISPRMFSGRWVSRRLSHVKF